MARLKSRDKFPPGEFRLTLPEVGMKKSLHGSFSEMVAEFAKVVNANPALAEKHGWPTDRAGQEAWLDQREAHRLIANGHFNFVDLEGQPPGGAMPARSGLLAGAGNVAGAAKTALAIYKDLFAGERPVERSLAETRAAVCVACPLNDTTSSLTHYFTDALAKSLTSLWGMLNDLSVATSQDDKLGVCSACACPMRAKVHVPLKVIKDHVTQEQWDRLHPACWIRSEADATR